MDLRVSVGVSVSYATREDEEISSRLDEDEIKQKAREPGSKFHVRVGGVARTTGPSIDGNRCLLFLDDDKQEDVDAMAHEQGNLLLPKRCRDICLTCRYPRRCESFC